MKIPLDKNIRKFALKPSQAFRKRMMDLVLSIIMLPFVLVLLIILVPLARHSTGGSGIFRQERVGLFGEEFVLYKLRSMSAGSVGSNVTHAGDDRITRFGRVLRKTKLDELPQLFNVLRGDMSFVGPRPDVHEVYENSNEPGIEKVLSLRPGITGPASIRFRNEEEELATVDDREAYNLNVIFPKKIKLNLEYIQNYSLLNDLAIMLKTVRK